MWKSIPGYEGWYEASDEGEVRRLDRIIPYINRWGTITRKLWKGRVLRQATVVREGGYKVRSVQLCRDGQIRPRLVHQLVMEAFEGARPEGMEVAHGDGNSINNRYSNLRYDTPKGNSADKLKHGTLLRGEQIGNSKLSESDARAIIAVKGKERLYVTAARYGVQQPQISRIQNGVRWGHLHVV